MLQSNAPLAGRPRNRTGDVNRTKGPTLIREIRFRRPDGREIGLETLRVEEIFERAGDIDLTNTERMHFHQIALVNGSCQHEVDFQTYHLGPRTLLAVRAGQTRAYSRERELSGPTVVFTQAFLDSLPDRKGSLAAASRRLLWEGPVLALSPRSVREAVRGFAWMEHLSSAPDHPFTVEALGAAFSAWLFTLAGLPEVLDRHRVEEARDPLVTRFYAVLEDHFHTERTVGFYARKLHASNRTLDRHLVDATGLTAKRAILERIVLEARRLLTQQDLQIKAIADELGFVEPQNFTRFFKTQTGETPQAFRERSDSELRTTASSPEG